MAQAIFTSKVTVVTHQTLLKFRESELVCESDKRKCNLFDDIIEKKLGKFMSYPENPIPKTISLLKTNLRKLHNSYQMMTINLSLMVLYNFKILLPII